MIITTLPNDDDDRGAVFFHEHSLTRMPKLPQPLAGKRKTININNHSFMRGMMGLGEWPAVKRDAEF